MRIVARAINPSNHELLSELSSLLRLGQEEQFLERFARRAPLGQAETSNAPHCDASENMLALTAIHHGLERALDALLEAGVDPDIGSAYSCPLLEAASRGELGCVKLLLSAGADPDGRLYPEAPLHAAAWFGRVDCCVALLQAGADPFKLDSQGRAPSRAAREIPDFGPERPEGAADAADAIDAWIEAQALRVAAAPLGAKPKAKTL